MIQDLEPRRSRGVPVQAPSGRTWSHHGVLGRTARETSRGEDVLVMFGLRCVKHLKLQMAFGWWLEEFARLSFLCPKLTRSQEHEINHMAVCQSQASNTNIKTDIAIPAFL